MRIASHGPCLPDCFPFVCPAFTGLCGLTRTCQGKRFLFHTFPYVVGCLLREHMYRFVVPQSLHKALPSSTLYYKAFTKHFPVLLCTTKLAQSTSQYYFCRFPYRHGDATGKPETRDETHGRSKTSISWETSSNFDTFNTLSNRLERHKAPRLPRKMTWQLAWKPSKRRGFAASPIDTELTTRRRRDEPLEVNKGPAPRPPDYKREPFATHSGKNETTSRDWGFAVFPIDTQKRSKTNEVLQLPP